ncbi:MAG: 30S ribosomal protein S8 [Rhodospirillaceae bacterium]|jgi:small subunit ribosomal protein S8|nr:30S ribosomal protein S8 [Rhodospirillaceae bacterium]
MSMTDPVADLLTRIRNGQRVGKSTVSTPASRLRGAVLDVLQSEGFIRGYEKSESDTGKPAFDVSLKYSEGRPAIKEIKKISKPGRRVYSGSKDLPRVYNGLGISILSTPSGVMSDLEARKQNVGGEVLCQVF